ncbi:MAG: GerMN domain-containing protein [Oscillospiraceae bacterium]|nr:GerMN domain-containing protein [Oscillospiraceae bacterium]
MKKTVSFLLIAMMLFSLGACTLQGSDIIEPVEFYYQRTEYSYGGADGVIAPEIREASGHAGDLPYLLALYLRGPLDSSLKAPFPTDSKILSFYLDGKTLSVTLDSTFASLQNMELTLACACFARTCFSLADVAQVQITALTPDDTPSLDITISADSLLLEDISSMDVSE